jgi:hypothetical protein
MKVRHAKALGLITIIASALSTGCGDHKLAPTPFVKIHRVVTISLVTDNDPSACEVDYPVALLRWGRNHTMNWVSADHAYWLFFPSGSPMGRGYTIPISAGGNTGDLSPVAKPASPTYYKYAIYSQDPGPGPTPVGNPCKDADDQHDTGLNVKK